MLMYGVLAISIPPFVIAGACMAGVFSFGLLVTITCGLVGAFQITR
jgi:uncharacterized membrane protein YeaQ/YmgE (transglycosylase-associated protein family)